MKKGKSFHQMMLELLDSHKGRKKKTHLNSYLTQYVKNNLRWIIEVNVKVETKMPFRETQENVCVFE